MTALQTITTAEQLFAAGDIGRCELIDGELLRLNYGGNQHGVIVGTLSSAVFRFAETQKVGIVYGAGTGFLLRQNPDTVRAPDVAFTQADRAPRKDEVGYSSVIPDFIIEVNSPSDKATDVLSKVCQWLDGGAKLVWVVDPPTRTITAHYPGGTARTFGAAETITGQPVLPDFQLPIESLFLP